MRARSAVWLLVAIWVGCKGDAEGNRFCNLGTECMADEQCDDGRCRACDDRDHDGWGCSDCDDTNPLAYPGANEICDAIDNDCDGVVDEDVEVAYYADADHDGYGQHESAVLACAAPPGFVADGTDCNDTDPTINPGRVEICDFRDNDCDGVIDEDVKTTFYRDADGDGYGDPANTIVGCIQPSGFIAVADDCDDTRPDVNPGAAESCNARDDDCDGVVDGQTRACDNACGAGVETCRAGLFVECNAPPIVTVSSLLQIKGTDVAEFSCLVIKSRVTTDPDTTIAADNWIRVEQGGQLELGARSKLLAGESVSFVNNGALFAPDVVIETKLLNVEQDARWFIGDALGVAYSAGGAAACTNGGIDSVGGGAGGARGGGGGAGGSCGAISTQPRAGVGGTAAASGADGCDCPCTINAAGGEPSGGDGGLAYSGGGGGGGGAAGGAGGAGFLTVATAAGAGGAADGATNEQPTTGGGGGGGGGTALTTFAAEACRTQGGSSGGLMLVRADRMINRGTLLADGAPGADAVGSSANAGGGGGGGGGSFVFFVDELQNDGSMSAVGGRGGNGSVQASFGCGIKAGGGGGGSGGRIYFAGKSKPAPLSLASGNLFLGGGAGGAGFCGGPAGTAGGSGWWFSVE